jgi:hypothetical protein
LVWAALALAMAAASALILWAGRGTSFVSDELLYYGRLVELPDRFTVFDSANAEYFLAPFSGHLQAVGKLVYEGIFATTGTDYVVFRVVALAALLLCVGLVFALIRRRVGAPAALAAAVLLLFLGSAWEVMLWPFDLHTVFAFAAGLGALLVLERGGRHADAIACALLVVSVATIEVGLAIAVGVAVLVLSGRDRLRRAWVFAVPIGLYAVWWVWSQRYEQGDFDAAELPSAPLAVAESLSATLGALVGRIDAGSGVFPQTVGINGWGIALAVVAVAALALRVRRTGPTPWLGALVVALLAYWVLIALAPDRPPDSSRYIWVGAALLLLVAAEAARGVRLSRAALAALALVIVVSLPLNITKLFDGRLYQVTDADANRAHYAMVELAAASEGPPPAKLERGGRDVFFGLEPGAYLEAVPRLGSIAFSLDELRASDERARGVADDTLGDLYELELQPGRPPAGQEGCRTLATEGAGVATDLSAGEVLLRPLDGEVALGLGRFANRAPSASLGSHGTGGWQRLAIPADPAPDPWRLFADGSIRLCEGPAG